MKWEFLFRRKKRNKKEHSSSGSSNDTTTNKSVYAEVNKSHSRETKYQTTEIVFETFSSSALLSQQQPQPPLKLTYSIKPSKSSREFLHKGELLSDEEFDPGNATPLESDFSGVSGTVKKEEEVNNEEETLAFCPHCHTIVTPITTKKRQRIRTNPWLPSTSSVTENIPSQQNNRKRPRLAEINIPQIPSQQNTGGSMQQQSSQDPLPSTSISMSDSGIFDPHNMTQSDTSFSALHDLEEVQGETEMEEEEAPVPPVPALPEFPVNEESDLENDRPLFLRKRKRRRKRRQRDAVLHSQQQRCEVAASMPPPQLEPRYLSPGPPVVLPTDTQRPSWLGTHLGGSYTIRHAPYDEVPQSTKEQRDDEKGKERVTDGGQDHLAATAAMDRCLDDEVTSILSPHESQFHVSGWTSSEARTAAPEPVIKPCTTSRSVDEIRVSLRDKIEKLCQDKWELERKFDMVQTFQDRQVKEQASLARTVTDYRRELVLRGLSTAHKQLDSQLDRLQHSYDSLLNIKMRSLYESSNTSDSTMWQHCSSPPASQADCVFYKYDDI